MNKAPLIIAISGASGSVYGLTIAEMALKQGIPLSLLISDTARRIVVDETSRSWEEWTESLGKLGDIEQPDIRNLSADISSGSVWTRGMVIAPCSMGTLGRIAAGISSNLIERSADVCLKERRRLVLLTRETPLSLIHIRNMQTITEAGGIIMPPVPAFYSKPQSVDEILKQSSARVMAVLGIPVEEGFIWPGTK